ncbi:MAG: hypothetical protein H6745_20420 [Deltaproteobacteria bacterium]|nr:hypothetical protein [Deltaproteobacteria bacterium]
MTQPPPPRSPLALGALALVVGLAAATAACEAEPADVLDTPRILALRADPATLSPGAEHAVTALAFAVTGELRWSLCPVAWAPTDPLSCPTGDAVDLGTGNPLVATLPADLDDLWLRCEDVSGVALPAVKRLTTADDTVNPDVVAFTTPAGSLPASVARATSVDLSPTLTGADPDRVVVSWYVTAGVLEPKRSVGAAAVTFTAPDEPGPVTLLAVARDKGGGVGWLEATIEVDP